MNRLSALVLGFALVTAGRLSAEVGYADGRFRCDRFVLTQDNSSLAPYRTAVTFGPGDAALTIRFEAEAPGVGKLAAEKAGKGAWACAENFELFLDVSGEGKSLLHLAVSANGDGWDERSPKAASKELDWTASARATADAYEATAVIPWSALGLKGRPAVGTRWRMNIGRNFLNAAGATVFSSFAATGVRYKNPAKFADLYFGSPDEVAHARKEAVSRELSSVRAELAACGAEHVFSEKLAAFERTGRPELVTEIRDELAVIRALRTK